MAPTPQQMIWGWLIPFALVLVLGFIGARIPRGGTWGLLLGLTVGFVLAYHTFMEKWPVIKPTDTTARAALVAIVFGLVCIGVSFQKIPWIVRALAAIAGAAVIIWYDFAFLPKTSQPKPFWPMVGAIAGFVLLMVGLFELLARKQSSFAACLAIGPVIAGMGLVLAFGYAASIGMILLAVAVMALACLIVTSIDKKSTMANGPVWMLLIPFFGLASPNITPDNDVPMLQVGLVLSALLLAFIPQLPIIRKIKPWKREILRFTLVVIPVAIAVVMAKIAAGAA